MSSLSAIPSPLDLVELRFLRTALVEVLLLALPAGLLGTFVVLRRLAFFTHAAGSVAFPGLVLADAAGAGASLAGALSGLGLAGGVSAAGRRGGDPGGAPTALILVAALALGAVLASDLLGGGAAVERLLFGTLLGLGNEDLVLSGAAGALALAGVGVAGRTWVATGFDPAAARAARLPAGGADLLLLVLVALAVAAALPAVGALLVTSLFVVPAAVARSLARSVPGLLVVAVGVAAATGVAGLYAAWALDTPPGPTIAVLGALLFAATAARGDRS